MYMSSPSQSGDYGCLEFEQVRQAVHGYLAYHTYVIQISIYCHIYQVRNYCTQYHLIYVCNLYEVPLLLCIALAKGENNIIN